MTDRPRPSGTTRSGLHRIQSEARVHSARNLTAYRPLHQAQSGTMPDATGRVVCPFCRKVYQFSQGLLDRQLRCSGCRGVFSIAADRRTFRIAPPPPADGEEVGTATRIARATLDKASDDLRSLAQQALQAIADKERAHPRPGSGSTPDAQALTEHLAKRRVGPPVLSGAGERRQHTRMRGALLGAGLSVIVLLGVALTGWTDERRSALMDFQEAPRIGADPAERILAMRRKGWSPTGIEPVTGLDRAIIDRSMVVPLGEILAPLHGMVPLIRGRIWVPASQRGEAESFLPLGPPETDAGTLRTMVDRGIPAVGWVEMQERVDRAARDFVPGLGTLLLTAQELRGTRADPVDLIAQGSLPGSAEIAAFEGDGVAVLREGGARVVRYQGRLARFHGDDWPRAWAVLELRTLPVLVADPRP